MKTKFRQLVIFILCIAITGVFATSVSAYNYSKNDVVYSSIPGDINGDRYVRANDARLCLRAAAKLDTLTDEQTLAADLSGTGEVTSANARKILRASANIETITATVYLSPRQNLVVGPLKSPTHREWNVISENWTTQFNIIETRENNIPPEVDGVSFDKLFTISATEPGSCDFRFQQRTGWNNELNAEFIVNVVVQ